MGPVEALEIALAKEQEAVELYKKLAEQHVNIKEIFQALMLEEQRHEKLILAKIQELSR